MNNSKNYTATHSIDTEWFAVDRNGRIALLDSNQEGCVPEQVFPALQLTCWYDSLHGIIQPSEGGLPSVNLPEESIRFILDSMVDWDQDALIANELFFKGFIRLVPGTNVEEIVNKSDEGHENLGFRVSEKFNVYWLDLLEGEMLKQAGINNSILGFWDIREYLSADLDDDNVILEDLFGFYIYRYDDYTDIQEPYPRVRVPKFQVMASDLNLKQEMLVQLPVDFQTDKYVPPMQYVACKQFDSN